MVAAPVSAFGATRPHSWKSGGRPCPCPAVDMKRSLSWLQGQAGDTRATKAEAGTFGKTTEKMKFSPAFRMAGKKVTEAQSYRGKAAWEPRGGEKLHPPPTTHTATVTPGIPAQLRLCLGLSGPKLRHDFNFPLKPESELAFLFHDRKDPWLMRSLQRTSRRLDSVLLNFIVL